MLPAVRQHLAGAVFSRSSPAFITASISAFACPVTTTKRQGCRFLEDGARVPALRISSSSSRDTGLSSYARMLRLCSIASIISSSSRFLPDCIEEKNRRQPQRRQQAPQQVPFQILVPA